MELTKSKAEAFHQMHRRDQILVLPNPWDVGSARLLEHLGFEALATTSAGFAHSQGKPDGQVGRDAALAHAADIAAATSLPVSADLENCFADDPSGVAATVSAAAGIGIVGCSVEDATGDPAKPIYDFDLAVERVTAAVAAANEASFKFTLTARAENYLHGRPDLADTIARLQAFADAGASVAYAPGITAMTEIRELVAAVPIPVNVLAMPGMTVGELESVAVARVSIGSGLARAAMSTFYAGAREIVEKGSFGYGLSEPSTVDLNGIFSAWADRTRD